MPFQKYKENKDFRSSINDLSAPTERQTSLKPLMLRNPLYTKGFFNSTATNFCPVARV